MKHFDVDPVSAGVIRLEIEAYVVVRRAHYGVPI